MSRCVRDEISRSKTAGEHESTPQDAAQMRRTRSRSKPLSYPLTHMIKHLEGAEKTTHPNPRILGRRGIFCAGMERGSSGTRSAWGKKKNRRRRRDFDGSGGIHGDLGHGRGRGEEKETADPNTRGAGYMR